MVKSLVIAGALVAACGGEKAPPASAPKATADAASETFAEVNPQDVAELDAGGAKGAPSADTKSAAATPSTPEAPPDECTPVGVDFEKRARPQLKACYAEGKKKAPDLKGTVKITVDIDTLGKIKKIWISEKTLPDPVAQCMLKVVKATPLTEAAKCPGKSVTIPMTFPTPH
jgi:hypothetical protein